MDETIANVAVLGGGSFGTALANLTAVNGCRTRWWMRDSAQVEDIARHRENRAYLPGCQLHPELVATADITAALDGATLVLVAVPSHSCRQVIAAARPLLVPGAMVVSTTKGLEGNPFRLMSQVLAEELEGMEGLALGALSGPNLAVEIAAGVPTGTVIASDDTRLCQRVQQALSAGNFRVYANHDMFGVELGGALKNIYAIVCGIAGAMDVGVNTSSMLITRSLAEMSRFAVRLGADPLTFLGLAGVGDLIATSTSPLSRNYSLGQALGEGLALEAAQARVGQTAEGINTLRIVRAEAAALDVEMPIVEALGTLVDEGGDLSTLVLQLMGREQSTDVEFSLPPKTG